MTKKEYLKAEYDRGFAFYSVGSPFWEQHWNWNWDEPSTLAQYDYWSQLIPEMDKEGIAYASVIKYILETKRDIRNSRKIIKET